MFRTITTLSAMMPLIFLPAAAAQAEPAAATLSIGGGVAMVPEYAGSERMIALPLIVAEYNSGTGFFSGTRGVGYQTSIDAFTFSAALTYDAGRKDHKKTAAIGSNALRGMGDISGAVVSVVGINVDAQVVKFSVDAHVATTHKERGNTYIFGLSRPLYIGADNQIGVAANATYADRKSAQTYFGVSAAQSRASGYQQFVAAAGFQDVGVSINWNHVVDARWSIRTVAGTTRLVGDAADSPIVRRRSQALLASTLNYTF